MANDQNQIHQLPSENRRIKTRITYLLSLLFLLSLSYFLGASTITKLPLPISKCLTNPPPKSLDFESHHQVNFNSSQKIQTFPPCDSKYTEYTPCQDPRRARKFKKDMMRYRERHCPKKEEILKCLITAPINYKNPFKWPESRDFAWYDNIPHRELSIKKAVQNWIQVEGKRFKFPGGGTMFPHGADKYIDDINNLINLTNGNIRTALDTGCGVASWGAYLLNRNILTMSFAPRDSHEAQIQFALERGVPAMIGVMGTERMPYPARAFDMAHCSRCLIPWNKNGGLYLMEVDRVLRPGGYWILSGPPINYKKHFSGWNRSESDLNQEQQEIQDLTARICWTKVIEKGDLAIWQKPLDHTDCIKNRADKIKNEPPFCEGGDPDSDSDSAWYTKMSPCITPLPSRFLPLSPWPLRANQIPPRVISSSTHSFFIQNSNLWINRVNHYKSLIPVLSRGRFRNILDMNGGIGSFAAALREDDVWVMNVVPVGNMENLRAGLENLGFMGNLGVIYERGMIGSYHDWCEAFSTYPRSYDLIHADTLFTFYEKRCDITNILLEMDRILRPEGTVIFRDNVEMLVKIQSIIEKMRWKSQIMDHESGPFSTEKILIAVKSYWTAQPK